MRFIVFPAPDEDTIQRATKDHPLAAACYFLAQFGVMHKHSVDGSAAAPGSSFMVATPIGLMVLSMHERAALSAFSPAGECPGDQNLFFWFTFFSPCGTMLTISTTRLKAGARKRSLYV
jgi:hypothetical protein